MRSPGILNLSGFINCLWQHFAKIIFLSASTRRNVDRLLKIKESISKRQKIFKYAKERT